MQEGLGKHVLVEHDGSAISVFDKHPDEGHTDEDVVGVIVLRDNKIDESSYREEYQPICHRPTFAGKVSWPKPSSFSTSLMYSSSASAACIRLESKELNTCAASSCFTSEHSWEYQWLLCSSATFFVHSSSTSSPVGQF